MNLKKLAESYKKAVETCCCKEIKTLKEDKVFKFKIGGKNIEQVYKKGFIVPDLSESLLGKWVKINYMINAEFEDNGREILKELEKIGL
jgi:rRNA-processing protein FCF1